MRISVVVLAVNLDDDTRTEVDEVGPELTLPAERVGVDDIRQRDVELEPVQSPAEVQGVERLLAW
jgi:hypothetical protein